MDGAGFFLRGGARVKIFGSGQGEAGRGRAGQGSRQNLSISADLDNLLNEGEP